MHEIAHPIQNLLTRRQLLQGMGASLGLTLAAACTPLQLIKEERATLPPVPEQPVIIFWGDPQHPLEQVVAGFRATHPTVEWHAPRLTDRTAQLQAAFAAGTGLPDLYWAAASAAQAWGCQAVLTNLTPYLEPELADYHPAKLAEAFIAKEEIYIGWPGDLGISGWYYRADQMSTALGSDQDPATWTWQAFIERAVELRKQNIAIYTFPATGWSPLFFLLLHQVGGTAVSQDGERITVADEKGVQAMRLVRQLWEAGAGLDVAYGSPAYWEAIKAGRLIGDFAPVWAAGAWEAALQADAATSGLGQWRIAPLPGGDPIMHRTGLWGGGQLIMPQAAAHPESALRFMRYALSTVEGAGQFAVGGVIPAYRPYLQAAACAAQRTPLFGDWPLCQWAASQEQELSTTYFQSAGWDAVAAAVQQEMMAIVLDTYSVEDGMSRIADRAMPAFQQAQCT